MKCWGEFSLCGLGNMATYHLCGKGAAAHSGSQTWQPRTPEHDCRCCKIQWGTERVLEKNLTTPLSALGWGRNIWKHKQTLRVRVGPFMFRPVWTHIYSYTDKTDTNPYSMHMQTLVTCLSPLIPQNKNMFSLVSPAGSSIWRAGSSQWRWWHQCQLHRYAESRTLHQWTEFSVILPALPGQQWDRGHSYRSAI